jgi:type II secretory pathway predicted ATPase ExeA
MYESYFRLSHRPFVPAPRAEGYIPTSSLDAARQTLTRCIERGEGPAIAVGPAGTGKSLLCQVLARHFRGRFHVVLLCGARLATRRALLQNILFELKLPYRDMDEGELRLSLVDHLEPRSGGPEGLLLLVDEAHTLPLRLLEEVRLLTNLVRDGQSRVRLVLAGGMALEERLASPKLESFHQRIAARCYLQPFSRDETIYYVQEQIKQAGGAAERLLTAEARAAVHTATDGIPRLINQLCDHALLLAALGGHLQLDAAGIEEAWADLQQLPIPLHEPPVLGSLGSGSASGIVEFGQLAEEPAAVAGTIGPSVADAAVASLDAIGRTIESLHAPALTEGVITGTAADDFSPADASGTEVELIFHGAHDPFGGHWEEEEVVIDRFASLEDQAIRNRQRATTDEGKAMGAAVTAALGPVVGEAPEPLVSPARPPHDHEAGDDAPLTIAASADFHPASDPLLPEESVLLPPARRATVSLRELGQDDRDMIVVEEDQTPRAVPLAGRPKRPEYRQLFSTLRSK